MKRNSHRVASADNLVCSISLQQVYANERLLSPRHLQCYYPTLDRLTLVFVSRAVLTLYCSSITE